MSFYRRPLLCKLTPWRGPFDKIDESRMVPSWALTDPEPQVFFYSERFQSLESVFAAVWLGHEDLGETRMLAPDSPERRVITIWWVIQISILKSSGVELTVEPIP
jgi:hypothetical protein